MTKFVALLRAVNLGGTGKLPMADLKALCVDAGFDRVETYIASGNVVFECKKRAVLVESELESRLHNYARKPVQVFVRTAAELQAILLENPFPRTEPKHTYVLFLKGKPPRDVATDVRRQANEELRVGKREIYIHYPAGMGQSKLQIAAARNGTARNINTITKLVEMTS